MGYMLPKIVYVQVLEGEMNTRPQQLHMLLYKLPCYVPVWHIRAPT